MKIRVAINGFGRIGRNLFRLLLNHPNIEVVAINDIADIKTMSHLLKYDSIHGVLQRSVSTETHNKKDIFSDKTKKWVPDNQNLNNTLEENETLLVDDLKFQFFHESDISKLPWKALNIDFVIEATGKFKTTETTQLHISAGAKKVILSAPPEDEKIKTVVLGVNEHILDGTETIISNASCTTNNAAPMLKIIQELCGIEQAYITTVHSYTTDQSLHDQPHKDLRRARGASQSIIPTTTGAAKAITKIFPELDGKIGGCGIRVPVPDGSLTDITFNVKRKVSIEEINFAFKKASENEFKNILAYTEDPIVSVDIIGNTNSCVFDAQLTSVIDKMVKIVGWYDNEIGYSSRLVDLMLFLSKKNH